MILFDSMYQPDAQGPELSKRLIYQTAMERLRAIYEQHGVSVKEDTLIKMLAEMIAESQERSLKYGFSKSK